VVLCIVALVVLGFLSIFSAEYRPLAREALRCVTRMLTLRPCESSFEQRIKSGVTTRLMGVSPGIGGFFYKHFSILSWAFTGSFFASMAYSLYSLYNYATLHTCTPGSTTCPLTHNSLQLWYDALIGSWEAVAIYIAIAAVAILMVKSGRGASQPQPSEEEQEEG